MENGEMGKELKTAVSPSAVLFASASEATATWRYTNFVLYCIAKVKMIHNHVLVRSVEISGHQKVSGQVKVSRDTYTLCVRVSVFILSTFASKPNVT